MNVGIVGSRGWEDWRAVDAFVSRLPVSTVIVSGGAQGVDTYAEEAAKKYGLICIVVHAAWHRRDGTLNKAAGHERNPLIVEISDVVVAFWDGVSPGTRGTIGLAKAAGKYRERK